MSTEAERFYGEDEADGQLTLGTLLQKLEGADPDALVEYRDHRSPGTPHSYRGYYDELALEDCSEGKTTTVSSLREVLKGCLGRTFRGWKGGEFVMEARTPLWRAFKGECGASITSVSFDRNERRVVLDVAEEDP